MSINSLIDTLVFFERRRPMSITYSSNTVLDNIIVKDDNENDLKGEIDSGDTYITQVKEYEGDDSLLLYNIYDDNIRVVKKGEKISNFKIDFYNGTRVYLGAKRVFGKYKEKNIYNTDTPLSEYSVLKIFSDNGKEIKNYDIKQEDSTITIKGNDRYIVDDETTLIIYVYKTIQSGSFVLQYEGYNKILDLTNFLNEEYFMDSFDGNSIDSFESFDISLSSTEDTIRQKFTKKTINVINYYENKVSIDIFDVSEKSSLLDDVKEEEFRLILVNPNFGRVCLINNCTIKPTFSNVFEKGKVSKSLEINFSNYIEVTITGQSYYGKASYGIGKYGGESKIFNTRWSK